MIFIANDFNISEIVAVFDPGETESVIFISITKDLLLEQDELFDVVLTDVNTTGVKVGIPRSASVLIMNSNSKFYAVWQYSSKITLYIALTVTFNQREYSVNESDEQVTIALDLSRPPGQNVTIGIRGIPNTAQGNYFIVIP